MKKYYIVTGSAGFLGRHISRLLAQCGETVVGIGHDSWNSEDPYRWGISHWHAGHVNLENLETLAISASYIGRPQAIIHCAGGSNVGYSVSHPREDFLATVCSLLDVLEFSRLQSPITKIIYPSSAAVYGAFGPIPLQEDLPTIPISPYGIHKRIAEKLCISYGIHYNVPSVIVRFFSIYGSGLRKQLLWDACSKANSDDFNFFGSGEEKRDWIHVEDAANLLKLSLEHASTHSPIVNGATGHAVSTREILTQLGGLLTPPRNPRFSNAAKLGDPDSLLADISRIQAWGFKPNVPLHQGLADYVRWYQNFA